MFDAVFEHVVGGACGALVSFLFFVLAWWRFRQGESDEVVVHAHYFKETKEGPCMMVRTVLPPEHLSAVWTSPVGQKIIGKMISIAKKAGTSVVSPADERQFGLILNCLNFLAGSCSLSPHKREMWVMALTWEPSRLVKQRCLRVLLIKKVDLEKYFGGAGRTEIVLVERPFYGFRLLALQEMGRLWMNKGVGADDMKNLFPLLEISLGLHPEEEEALLAGPVAPFIPGGAK